MPGRSAPRRSAPSTIASAMRSLYDPVGFDPSSLTTTSAAPAGTTRVRRTAGVAPIAFSTDSAIVCSPIRRDYHAPVSAESRPQEQRGDAERNERDDVRRESAFLAHRDVLGLRRRRD